MNGCSAQLAQLQRRSDDNLAEFLRIEVATGLRLPNLPKLSIRSVMRRLARVRCTTSREPIPR